MDMSVVKDFEKRFSEEVVEMLVLTKESVGGASVYGDMLKPSLNFIASVDVNSGELSCETGRLEWMIERSPDRKGWGYDFKQFEIYRIKARRNIPVELKENMIKSINNCYMVVEVIDENVSHEKLDSIKEKISKPVIIEEAGLGKLVLKREFSWFEGYVEYLKNKFIVFLETDEEDGDTAYKSLTILKELYKNFKLWDNRFRVYAANELTSLANDWLEDSDDYSEDTEPITEKEFANRIGVRELSIAPDGDLTLYYSDDDMFLGHSIEINANINGEISSADMVG